MEYLLVFLGNKRHAQTVNNWSVKEITSQIWSLLVTIWLTGFQDPAPEHTNSSLSHKVLSQEDLSLIPNAAREPLKRENLLVKY